jgi:hypothetical protein
MNRARAYQSRPDDAVEAPGSGSSSDFSTQAEATLDNENEIDHDLFSLNALPTTSKSNFGEHINAVSQRLLDRENETRGIKVKATLR